MKTSLWMTALLAAAPLLAHASCDEVKASIDAKLKANNVSHYSLEVVSGEPSGEGKVVGQCEGDKKIVYTKGNGEGSDSGAPAAPAPASSSSSS